MVVMTPLLSQLKEKFPSLFDWWKDFRLHSLGLREGDIEIIHELFGGDLLYTGIIALLSFTHGNSYPISSIASILDIDPNVAMQVIQELTKRNLIYSEVFGGVFPFYYVDRDLLLHFIRELKITSRKQRIKKIIQSEEPLLVFVSSVMNTKLENLIAERQMARIAIEETSFTRPWLFEDTPASSESLSDSFLKRVERSNLFILILGKHITKNVELEYKTAKNNDVRRLVFVKMGVERTQKTQLFIKNLDLKYSEFNNLNELRLQISSALLDELLRGFKE